MAVTANWFGLGVLGQWHATAARRVDWVGDTIKVGLTTVTWSPAQDTMDFYDDVTNELATATGYTAGGVAIGSKVLTYDGASNTVRLDAADAAWTFSASKTMRRAFIYKDTGSAATSPLLWWVDFGADETSSGTFTLQWDNTDGVLRAVVA